MVDLKCLVPDIVINMKSLFSIFSNMTEGYKENYKRFNSLAGVRNVKEQTVSTMFNVFQHLFSGGNISNIIFYTGRVRRWRWRYYHSFLSASELR